MVGQLAIEIGSEVYAEAEEAAAEEWNREASTEKHWEDAMKRELEKNGRALGS